MKKFLLLTLFILLPILSFGKSMGTHEHGALKLEIAAEEKSIEIDLDGPSDAFIGFEYLPTSAKEKETFTKAQDLWTNDLLTKLFVLDSSLNCKIVSSSFKQIIENDNHKTHNQHNKNSGVHSEIEAQAKITCEKVIKDQNIAIALKKHYPLMKKISIDLLGSKSRTLNSTLPIENLKL